VWVAALCEALERGTNPWDDQDLLTELVELWERLAEIQVDWVNEAKDLAVLVTRMSDALVDLGLGPIQWILEAQRLPLGWGARAGGGGHRDGAAA
jgi:hypothetical protein